MNAGELHMLTNALSGLVNLRSIVFENINVLIVQRNAPVPGLDQGQLSVTMDRIDHITLDAGSFSHWNEKVLDISITNISVIRIDGGAIMSSSNATTVTMENIATGRFFPGTFATTLGNLALRNVTTQEPCENNTFGGSIGELSLTSARLGEIREGCFSADETWDSLVVRSSHLGNVSGQALSGTIRHVRIDQTSLGRIHTNGFDLDVLSFSINGSSIDSMDSDALNVQATFGISVQRSRINTVHENAFYGLNASQDLTLSQLTMNRAENGSLRVSDVKSLILQHVLIRVPCECDIQQKVEQLFFEENPPGSSTEQENAILFESVYTNIQCLHNGATPSLREYYCSHCQPLNVTVCDTAYKSTEKGPPYCTPAVPTGTIPVASIGWLAVALAAIIGLFYSCRRQRASRLKLSSTPITPDIDISHPLQDLEKERTKERQQRCTEGQQRYTPSPHDSRAPEEPQMSARDSDPDKYMTMRNIRPRGSSSGSAGSSVQDEHIEHIYDSVHEDVERSASPAGCQRDEPLYYNDP